MAIFTAIAALLSSGIGAYRDVQKQDSEARLKVMDAKAELKLAKLAGETQRYLVSAENDASYDNNVLKNRRFTYADELIIGVWLSIFIGHFIPPLQPYMAGGWAAMGYTTGPPWWFEFGMVGILVSTLGLMALFKIWTGRGGNNGNPKASGH